jgi:glyoxylase-like metal-dependent hydrolase (beta-lactamase superfamily II)
VLLAGFPAGPFGTNTYVLAAPGERALIVDPGFESTAPLAEMLAEHGLTPGAVLLTHGHLDHTFSVVPVCGASDIPAYIHPRDRALLTDPMRAMSAQFAPMIAGMTFTEPAQVIELPEGDSGILEIAGLRLVISLAPGHTQGSVTFGTADGGPDGEPVLISGDVLFAGSIGRTDLPGGSHEQMMASLARVILPLPDQTLVLCGHGPSTTIGRERASNPYLQDLTAAAPKGRSL